MWRQYKSQIAPIGYPIGIQMAREFYVPVALCILHRSGSILHDLCVI